MFRKSASIKTDKLCFENQPREMEISHKMKKNFWVLETEMKKIEICSEKLYAIISDCLDKLCELVIISIVILLISIFLFNLGRRHIDWMGQIVQLIWSKTLAVSQAHSGEWSTLALGQNR